MNIEVGHRYMTNHNRVVDIFGEEEIIDRETGTRTAMVTGKMWEVNRIGVAGENQRWRKTDGGFGFTGVPSSADLVQRMGKTPQ